MTDRARISQNPYQMGGSNKAEGFADGEWTNHRQAAFGNLKRDTSRLGTLAAATQISKPGTNPTRLSVSCDVKEVYPGKHGQTSLSMPSGAHVMPRETHTDYD